MQHFGRNMGSSSIKPSATVTTANNHRASRRQSKEGIFANAQTTNNNKCSGYLQVRMGRITRIRRFGYGIFLWNEQGNNWISYVKPRMVGLMKLRKHIRFRSTKKSFSRSIQIFYRTVDIDQATTDRHWSCQTRLMKFSISKIIDYKHANYGQYRAMWCVIKCKYPLISE